MIEHSDYDDYENDLKREYVLPDRIDSIVVTHDGGRLGISINSEQAYYTCEGTRDCSITLDRRTLTGEGIRPEDARPMDTIRRLLTEAAQNIRELAEDLDEEQSAQVNQQLADIEKALQAE